MMRPHNFKQILINAFFLTLLCCGWAKAQAPTITSISPTSGAVGVPVTLTGTNFGSSQGSSTVALNGTNAVAVSWSATTIVAVVPTGASSGDFTVTVNSQPASSSTFTIASLPSGWTDQDVGTVGLAGSASYATGVFTVKGAGDGMMSYTTDAMNFAYQSLSGNGTIVARVVSTSNTYAQAGVMIRETLNSNARSMFVGDYAGSIYTFVRTTTGGSPSSTYIGAATLPYWVMLVRNASSFTGYQSLDGVNWTQVGSTQTISMAQNVYVGLAVSSGTTGALYTGTFDNVSINSTASPAPVISSVSATTGSIGSQVVINGSNFGSSLGSGVVLLNDAVMMVNFWSATSVTVTIPSGTTSGPLVVSVLSSMVDSNPVEFTVTSTPLPSGWLDQDVGAVSKAGTAGYANGIFTVQTASTGVNTACFSGASPLDTFHFVYQPLSGNGTIVARVVSPTSVYGQSGLMIRNTMDPSSPMVFVADYSGYLYAWSRILEDTTASCANPQIYAPFPYWLQLQRSGNTINVLQSPDGVDWTPIGGSFEISMPQTVYIGMVMTGGSASSPYSGDFDSVSVSSSSETAPVITSLSATTGPAGSQIVVSGSGFGSTQSGSVVLLNDAPVTINSWSATSINITIPSAASSGPMAVQVAPEMDSSNAVMFTVTTQPLPSGWFDQDVGTVGKAGNASYSNGVFTVQGAGVFLSAYADALHFVYQPMSTDGTIIARVSGTGSGGAYATVMIRETLAANAPNVAAAGYAYSGGSTPSMDYRSVVGGYELSSGGTNLSIPYWLEVVRNANQFSVYEASDGVHWTQIGNTQTVTTAQTVYVGFGVASDSTSTLDTATFDNVSVNLGSALPNPVISSISPTTGAPGQSVTVYGSGFGATQGSNTISFNGATGTVSSWSDGQIVAAVPYNAPTGPVTVTNQGITAQGPTFTVAFNVQVTDSLGNQTTYVSAPQGGEWSLTSAQGSGCSTCTTRGTVQQLFDGNGNLQSTTDALGYTTAYDYDSSNNLIWQGRQANATSSAVNQYTYNSFGEVLTATDPLGNVTTNTYDSHGNLLTVTTPSPSSGAAASVTTFTYNSLGELLTIKDPLNNTTTLTYTTAGFINTITDAQNNVTTYGYDSHGNRTSVTDALNHQTTFTYDAMDRLTKITYPDTTTTQFAYDYRGRRTSVTDQNGKATTYAYDEADRL